MKYDYLVAEDNNSLNSELFEHSIISLIVSSSGILVKSESTSKLPL